MDTDIAALLLLYFSRAVVQAGPRVCGVRGRRAGTSSLPASSSREGQLALQLCSPAHRKPRLSRRHREALLLTAAGRGALLLCGTAGSKNGSKSGSERPPESG